jgi:hypothetical protein
MFPPISLMASSFAVNAARNIWLYYQRSWSSSSPSWFVCFTLWTWYARMLWLLSHLFEWGLWGSLLCCCSHGDLAIESMASYRLCDWMCKPMKKHRSSWGWLTQVIGIASCAYSWVIASFLSSRMNKRVRRTCWIDSRICFKWAFSQQLHWQCSHFHEEWYICWKC